MPPLTEFKNIAVLGSGSWATALVKILSQQSGLKVRWWLRSEETKEYIDRYHHNPRYLSSVEIHPASVETFTDMSAAVQASEVVVLAIPSAFLAKAITGTPLPKDKIYVSAIKGIDPESRLVIATWLEEKHGIPPQNLGLITGPCHAEEVALEKLSYLTISALDLDLARRLETLINCRFINTTVNTDLYGAEYAAVLKNIYAIGAGIAHGLGYGDNFQAVYVGAALREMEVFLDGLHQVHRDVKNAAYLGDLLVTCYSQFSRNRTFGNMLGKGYSVKTAQLEMNMIAEGYYAISSVHAMMEEMKVEMPVVRTIHDVVYRSAPAGPAFAKLAAILN